MAPGPPSVYARFDSPHIGEISSRRTWLPPASTHRGSPIDMKPYLLISGTIFGLGGASHVFALVRGWRLLSSEFSDSSSRTRFWAPSAWAWRCGPAVWSGPKVAGG